MGEKQELEIAINHHELGQRYVKAKLIPHKSNAQILGFYVLAMDITDRKKHEEELLHTQKMDSIGLLSGGLAHDFNNYLTSILGNVALAKIDIPADNDTYTRLENTEKACIRAKNITQQLLAFSKGGEAVKEPVDLAALIIESAEFSSRGSNCKCKFVIQSDLCSIEADKGQISQVINNLVINSIQSMPDGGLINISAVNKPASNKLGVIYDNHVLIEIQDSGIGIDEKHMSKIFDPYFTTKQSGSGLGLANVYSIIKKHSGNIEISSLLGKGTKISIILPATNSGSSAVDSHKTKNQVSYSGRVLVMDDGDEVRDALCNILQKLGFDIYETSEGSEAILEYERSLRNGGPYDIVVLDLTIPGGMGGKETMARLKEIDPDVNALICSGYSNDPVMSDYEKFGFSGVIKKPYTIEDLKSTLNKILRR
ncbi:MAG: response regulator [Candidatus Dadabacteria bacterium]|nr:response regulator [Candidatus Dadabacteria bacterium]NIS07693.1 response regulator [Candidatus Dadabacteria bacterium]NIV42272.1 response regulator [Candidatus Dadabacteria bacterium]NIX14779.1 response regulator [Candidatus Dadabacteria bacterium]NIY21320.1 response regulator [Candidatus Dadabacteria bacterium]